MALAQHAWTRLREPDIRHIRPVIHRLARRILLCLVELTEPAEAMYAKKRPRRRPELVGDIGFSITIGIVPTGLLTGDLSGRLLDRV
ncbi:hypothetical protein C4J98_3301 [Pseudomonas orientalis]|nr:hypothetical protein C4J98_3301 [Pseudomonas orientalis]